MTAQYGIVLTGGQAFRSAHTHTVNWLWYLLRVINASREFAAAAKLIDACDGLLVTAGAGMGVDSGLPDFRGQDGFWKAYPALRRSGVRFEDIANPEAFRSDPYRAWGFYGHRLNLYRETHPHDGFRILLEIAERIPHGISVFTSNVDGQFQRAGFMDEWIVECHGSIHHLQCFDRCQEGVWSAKGFTPTIDAETGRLTSPLPRCPACGGLARPNVLMFGDWDWVPTRSEEQQRMLRQWLREVSSPVVIELGAGLAIPTVRRFGEGLRCPVIRINPREPELLGGDGVSLPVGALEGLLGIARALGIRSAATS